MSSRVHQGGPPQDKPLSEGGNGSVAPEAPGAMAEWAALPPPDSGKAIAALHKVLPITRRQAEVLHWIAEAKTNEEIAAILGCSFGTVKTHIQKIFERLNVHSRIAAAACAYRAHFIASSSAGPSSDRPIAGKNHFD
jgi:DNA-binding NarL/FixJ family response regulator